MGIVKYTGPVASFHCPTNAEIRSLKVHFSPKQEGTGDPSPENVREIVGWDGVVVHNDDGIVVPEEYQKVEYIESNGAQYLNTQINGVSGLNIECILMLNSNANIANCGMIGSRENSDATRFYAISFYQNKWHVGMPNDSSYREVLTQVKYKARLETSSTRYVLYVNDEVYGSLNSHQDTTYPLYVFACNNYGTAARGCSGRVYSVLIDNGTTKLFNGIPCRRKSDNKPGMYDTVSGEFFTNQGTGEFICGPDVGETVDYEFGVLGKNKFPAADGTESNCFLSANTTYTLSATSASEGYFRGYYEDGTNTGIIWINQTRDGNRRSKVITPEKNIVRGLMYVSTGMSECQIELGSTATSYEPYDPNKTVYGGWVDLISGEVQEDGIDGYPYYSIVLDGTEEWTLVKQDNEASIFKYYYGVSAKTESKSICSHFKMILPSYTSLSCHNGFVHGMSGNLFIQPVNSIASTVEEFQTYLASQYQNGTPVTVLFQANKTPITYHLAPTQLQTFLGQNNVWSNADYVEVEYDLHETQEILNRKAFIMANQPHLVAPAAAQLQSFTTDLAAPLKECKVYFNPVQEGEGTPSPENVRPISGWAGLEIIRSGKNLYNPATVTMNMEIGSDGKPLATGSSNNWCITDFIPVKQNTTYIATALLTRGSGRSAVYNANKEKISTKQEIVGADAQTIINVGNDGYYVRLTVRIGDGLNTIFEESPSITTYEPYNDTTIPITFPTEAGTIYGGYVDLVRGEVVAMWKELDLSTTNWSYAASTNRFETQYLRDADRTRGLITAISDMYLSVVNQTGGSFNSSIGDMAMCFNISSGYPYIVLHDSRFTSAEELISSFSGHQMFYKLAEPIHYSLTPQQLKTLRGTNNIWSNSNGYITVQFWRH